MNKPIEINSQFELAASYVNTTNEHLYLTGKAGSGKTTFLKYIKENCHKKTVIAAPTGVAAMNAGGVTLHSLFQLPMGSFMPDQSLSGDEYGEFFDKKKLLKYLRLNSAKRELLRDLELLIIDEVSMLRADLLDAIDAILKSVRRNSWSGFGGVQVLFIGDLFQLPPVIKNNEWSVLQKYYKTISFFDAKVLQDSPPIYLELKSVYRQSDQKFIDLLNKIRNDKMDRGDLELLNKYYKPDFEPEKKGEYITLTTHNKRADIINEEQLGKLEGATHSFQATVTGDFNEATVTAETDLKLKKGAQIMFIRNDKGEDPRYYNGKIGLIKQIDQDDIVVVFADSKDEILVEKETWENKRYKLNKETDELDEVVKGTFTQYPIRLAWAITIHKSQGLTFDKAIIDAGQSFSPGQVYVALSRLTSLDGLALYSSISDSCIRSDQAAIDFSTREQSAEDLQTQLKSAQISYVSAFLLKAFDWSKLKWGIKDFFENMEEKRIPEKDKAIKMISTMRTCVGKQEETAGKFVSQLNSMLPEAHDDKYQQIKLRVKAATDYFKNTLDQEVLSPLSNHYDSLKVKSGVKKYMREIHELISLAKQKQFLLEEMALLTEGLSQDKKLPHLLTEMAKRRKIQQQAVEEEIKKSSKKKVKGESQLLSLSMYKDGKTVEKIAEERSLSPTTIEGHLMSFIGTEFLLSEFVSEEKIAQIKEVMKTIGAGEGTNAIKAKLGEEFSYNEIRAVLNHENQA
ncbi:MAG: helix-turn-helix domain-containing protein [Reichenbachiella sp.]|uniref:helix-turn-helix domain-containing protein n=1 Tax=Reichenbachiella sp. TaxID=2184521 RepID=UPI003266BE9F